MFPVQREELRINHVTPLLIVTMPLYLIGSCGGQIRLRTSSDIFIFNLELHFKELFRERYILKVQTAFEGHRRLQS